MMAALASFPAAGAALGAALALAGLGRPAAADEVEVPGRFPTVAAAVAAARDGDVIRIAAGVHRGNVVLDRRVTLAGEDGATIEGDGKGDVIRIRAEGCAVRGLRIERSGRAMAPSDAGIRIRAPGTVIEDDRISSCLFGIYLDRAGGATIRRNTILGMTDLELGDRGSGIHLYDSRGNAIEDDFVEDARDGIYFDHADGNAVTGCSFRGSRYGLHYMYSNDNRFIENRFSDCIAGAAIMYSKGLVWEGNWFVRNRGFSAVGILLKDCYGGAGRRNVLADNSTGLLLDNSMGNVFRENLLLRNDVAVHLFSGSDGNTFAGNSFIDNLSPLRVLGGKTATRWAEGGRGNYWSGYAGYDLDGDGVGDVPYRIQDVFEFVAGESPALRLFLVSAAAEAMTAAEEAFPLFEFSREVDPAPLVAPVEVPLSARWRAAGEGARLPAAAAFAAAFVLAVAAALIGRRPRGPVPDRPAGGRR